MIRRGKESAADITLIAITARFGNLNPCIYLRDVSDGSSFYVFYPKDTDEFEASLDAARNELSRTGSGRGQASSHNSSNNSRGNNSSLSSSQSQRSNKARDNSKSYEMPLKFESILKMRHTEGKYYEIQSKHYGSGSIIYVTTKDGKYLDQTSLGDYDLDIDYMIGDNWLSVRDKDARHIFLNSEENKGNRSRIATLTFKTNGEEQGVITLVQLAQGATASW